MMDCNNKEYHLGYNGGDEPCYVFKSSDGTIVKVTENKRPQKTVVYNKWYTDNGIIKLFNRVDQKVSPASMVRRCYDVSFVNYGVINKVRCYGNISLKNDIEDYFAKTQTDENFALAVNSFFDPKRIAERLRESLKYDTSFVYLGKIVQDYCGEYVSSYETNVDLLYKLIRDDEKDYCQYILDCLDPKLVDGKGDKVFPEIFSSEEIGYAEKRMKKFVAEELEELIANHEVEFIEIKDIVRSGDETRNEEFIKKLRRF